MVRVLPPGWLAALGSAQLISPNFRALGRWEWNTTWAESGHRHTSGGPRSSPRLKILSQELMIDPSPSRRSPVA
ncbi:hypothetical protein B0H15DRAFT_870238 [Mycena belliarum]|uniref:Uncharacterized protein n=1 Tax=Mycena belliarum TaxID=1033014 RepID=A0AAD6XIC1_9AGAR|nr:hypothetical protein B0H15DRAFT_870238 [Mycena belliae]